ncbi:hypothetical protein F6B41_26025 [Microbacterium lushaniae]|nr:hypothetical protein F6B41_29595 [Microbacterium lushaniae]KAA9149392.1 hypothetical protein F6B41_26025 [Microbacterium lushaniae]
MATTWRRIAIAVVFVGGFAAYWASIAFAWRVPLWGYLVGGVACLGAISALSIRGRPRPSDADLSASDAYSDAYLGRSAATHPHLEPAQTSHIDESFRPDPLLLPPAEDTKPTAAGEGYSSVGGST